jgi:hypothetical protein
VNRPRGSVVFVPDGPGDPLVQGTVVDVIWRQDPAKRRLVGADPILYGYVVELPDGRLDEYRLALCQFPPRPVA